MKQDGFVVRGADAKLERIKVPIPGPDECYVKVLIAGVCNTDLEIMKGYMGFEGVVGHEFVGLCESAPHSHQHLVGKRVVGEINLACTTCGVCERGGPRARNHCPKRTVLGHPEQERHVPGATHVTGTESARGARLSNNRKRGLRRAAGRGLPRRRAELGARENEDAMWATASSGCSSGKSWAGTPSGRVASSRPLRPPRSKMKLLSSGRNATPRCLIPHYRKCLRVRRRRRRDGLARGFGPEPAAVPDGGHVGAQVDVRRGHGL